jgi:amino acid adenylation domain-containing protein
MNTLEFLSYLRSLEVKLSANGDQLRLSAPKGVLTPTLREELAERKVEILAFLDNVNRAADSTLVPLQPGARNGNLPLSSAQKQLWFLAQLEPDSTAYNLPVAYHLTGQLNVVALEKSVGEILQRHEALRTTFTSVNGQPIQVITQELNFTLPIVDLRKIPESERKAEAQRLVTEERERPFDLTTGPLFRTQLLHLDQEEYLLLVTMHHSVSDGWSIGVFEQELAALYEAFCTGKPSPLPELSIQYADFVHWQQQWLQSEEFKSQLEYWKQQLAGNLPVLELPTDRPRPPVQTDRGAEQSLLLPEKLSEALKDLSRQQGVTLSMTLLAGFKTLLYRYTGQEDMIVGSPIAGRNRVELEGLIGFFISTLVMRTDLSGNPSFRELLNRVRKVTLGAYAHQDVPFEKLVEELQPERDLSRTPIFQVWFNMLNLADNELKLSGLKVEPYSIHSSRSKFDLTLYVREQQQGIQLILVYNADLFEPERMVEMLEQFNYLLEQIVEQPEARIADFSLVTPKAQLILPNPTQAICSKWEGALHTRFSQNAQRLPQKLAVVDAHTSWSYTELNACSNQLAHYLLANGIQQQEVVAIYGHRSASLIWAMLGILKAGAAFVILDPAYPDARLIDYLQITQPKGLLQLEAAGTLPAALEEVVETLSCRCRLYLPQHPINSAFEALRDYSTDDPIVEVDPDQLTYVEFTSGSTGKPKGIIGTHRPLSHFMEWHGRKFGFNESDRFSMLSGLSHDIILRDIFTPLWLGATLCIPEQKDMEMSGRLAAWMQQHQISVTHLTPAMGQLLCDTPPATPTTKGEITSLRYLFFGGDALTMHDVVRIRKLAPNATCVNFYGATETPQAMGYFIIPNPTDKVHEGDPTIKKRIPVGRGIEDVQLLVLNTKQQLSGVGELGEIHIRTPYLSQGYIGNDELTQERFLINPFTKAAGDRLYKTGDVGRYLPDGNIEFAGRMDYQVKIRGFRIEVAEIEAALAQHPAVRETVVIAREDRPGDKRLVAYVVPHQEQLPKISELRQFLQGQLPQYMVPSAFVMLEALPLTPNKKIDRRALPAPDQVNQEPEEAFAASQDEIELLLTKIWEKVLGIQSISVRDNFFELGGHSLLAVRLLSEIEKVFGKNLPLATFFEAQTVEQLANFLRQEEWSAPWRSLVMIQPGSTKPPLFCVHAIWGNVLFYRKFVRYLEPDQPFYALQAQGLDGKHAPCVSVTEMAAHYIQEIRTVQPEGPYSLGGYSFGGLVAFEMTRQLHAQGQKVALLAIFDTVAPSYGEPTSDLGYAEPDNFLGRSFFHLSKLLSLSVKDQLTYVRERLVWHVTAGKLKIFYRTYLRYIKRSLQDLRLIDIASANHQARHSYLPQVYPGRLTLLKASERSAGSDDDPYLGWDKLVVGGVEIQEVPGSHTDIMQEPQVQLLAEKLTACLDKAQADQKELTA